MSYDIITIHSASNGKYSYSVGSNMPASRAYSASVTDADSIDMQDALDISDAVVMRATSDPDDLYVVLELDEGRYSLWNNTDGLLDEIDDASRTRFGLPPAPTRNIVTPEWLVQNGAAKDFGSSVSKTMYSDEIGDAAGGAREGMTASVRVARELVRIARMLMAAADPQKDMMKKDVENLKKITQHPESITMQMNKSPHYRRIHRKNVPAEPVGWIIVQRDGASMYVATAYENGFGKLTYHVDGAGLNDYVVTGENRNTLYNCIFAEENLKNFMQEIAQYCLVIGPAGETVEKAVTTRGTEPGSFICNVPPNREYKGFTVTAGPDGQFKIDVDDGQDHTFVSGPVACSWMKKYLDSVNYGV